MNTTTNTPGVSEAMYTPEQVERMEDNIRNGAAVYFTESAANMLRAYAATLSAEPAARGEAVADECPHEWVDYVQAEYKPRHRVLELGESNIERYVRIGLMCTTCGAEKPALSAEPAAQGEADARSIEAAEAMGAKGGPAVEAERLAFEAWMKGHCWTLNATWRDGAYRSDAEQGGKLCPHAMQTRGLWAAWRDRAALAAPPAQPAERAVGEFSALAKNLVNVIDDECERVTSDRVWEAKERLQSLLAASPAAPAEEGDGKEDDGLSAEVVFARMGRVSLDVDCSYFGKHMVGEGDKVKLFVMTKAKKPTTGAAR